MQNNTDTILFRASGVGALMTDPRSAADKKAGVLSATAKTFVEKSWLFDKFAFHEPVDTPEMMKGKMCEEAATQLLQEVVPSESYRKINRGENSINLKNDFFSGTYDIDLPVEKIVEDIKNCFTVKTFMNASINKMYYTQIQVYMDLLKYDDSRINYCLVDTPEQIVTDLKNRMFYKYGCDTDNPDYLEACYQLERMHTPENYIDKKDRVKSFEIKRNQAYIDELKNRVYKARVYYEGLKLNHIDIKEIAKFTAISA